MAIQKISNDDIHRITSGQVITNLTSAVKELVENSLDAGATQINITFQKSGLESVTVTDNGSGIHQDDFPNICLKHYTSKLTSFENVETVQTLGFRGEAMSSLCGMAQVDMVTATKEDAPKGWSLHYKHSGELGSKELTSRSQGTTVTVSDLFHSLPVRKLDLTKNIKREFHHALQFLQCYALINVGVRLIVRNVDARGRKSVMLSTTGSKELKNNLLSVFGSNGMYGLEKVDFELNVYSKFRKETISLHLDGYVSNASFGQGRSASDRQFWYVNKRPVSLPKFSKAVTEMYKKFNHLQSPMILLDIGMDTQFVDINVTPDKKEVLFNNEDGILDAFREKFDELFSANDVKIPKNVVPERAARPSVGTQRTLEKYTRAESEDEEDERELEKETSPPPSTDTYNDSEFVTEGMEEAENFNVEIKDFKADTNVPIRSCTAVEPLSSPKSVPEEANSQPDVSSPVSSPCCHHVTTEVLEPAPTTPSRKISPVFSTYGLENRIDVGQDTFQLNDKKRRAIVGSENEAKKQKLDNIEDTDQAEELLTLTISKSDFLSMKVIGQFNLGFILVAKKNENGDSDLFIVDQHASDEKYNFERLQRETDFRSQPLVVPQQLELNAIDEMVVMNHLPIFQRNGFKLEMDMDEAPGSRVKLVALPYSKNTVFDLADLNELINLVRQSSNPSVRPTKVRAMFAMRACRSSIMIGKPLNYKTMVQVVRHLSGLDKPWNCPHGRPTMRHLVGLKGWGTFSDDCK